MKGLKEHLYKLIKEKLPELYENHEGILNELLLKDYSDKLNEKLIEVLITDDRLREKFFKKIKDVYVFNISDFKFFIDENKLNNSYTNYENKIGLKLGSKLLKDIDDVVLNFPYKDCILEGGQSTEEGIDVIYEYDNKKEDYKELCAKREEIFFNEILAKDEIDRLLEPKALINWKKYSKDNIDGEIPKEIKRNIEGLIDENLIVKGNNLLALHSLKKEFKGAIKLIYIDPPYNTGNDSFAYNDKFNHSTWLTFMKNRVEIAKELLRSDGVIFIQINDHNLTYVKLILDEIFGKENCNYSGIPLGCHIFFIFPLFLFYIF